jgi:hypothetical protein
MPQNIGSPDAKWASQGTETEAPQDLHGVEKNGARKAFLSCEIAAFPQRGQVSIASRAVVVLGAM